MILNGNCLVELDKLPENSVDAIVTDPPYELNFMGKGWDNAGVSFSKETWAKCMRVLKPGGYMLAFGGTRTYHRIACAIEDAGFEIRDCIMWLYGSGFPKSMNIGLAIDKKNGVESKVVGYADTTMPDFRDVGKKQKEISGINKLTFGQIENSERKETPIYEAQNKWKGWGTALKPSYEPIIVARKPFKGSCVDNVIKYGVGGINIDECRVGDETISIHNAPAGSFAGGDPNRGSDTNSYRDSVGRFPANMILDNQDGEDWRRYFYCAKASKKDRDEGLDEFEEKSAGERTNRKEGSAGITAYAGATGKARNIHPTVKPTALMQYLVRLVAPKGATILDPFMGSGSTGKAVAYENKERNAGYKFIGIELDPEYCKIAEARIKAIKGGKG